MNQPILKTRRDVMFGLGASLGSLALTSLLQADQESQSSISKPHHTARAKRCIFLMMEGGPSHIDTFDPKPELAKQHLKEFVRKGEQQSAMSSGQTLLRQITIQVFQSR